MENEKVDKKGLASRVEELERALMDIRDLPSNGGWSYPAACSIIRVALAQPSGNTLGQKS